jgi:hypothetical protein
MEKSLLKQKKLQKKNMALELVVILVNGVLKASLRGYMKKN